MKTTNHFLFVLLAVLGFTSMSYAQVSVQVGSTPKQTMRYGMDYERLWFWSNSLSAAEKDMVAEWSVVDNDIDFIRVAINSGYELTEGDYDLSAYTSRIIPMMQDMQNANPDIKFFASPRPLDEAMDNVSWQPYPQWITGSSGSNSNFSFDWEKCAEYLVRYIELMDSYGFEISYLDLTNEWNFVTPTHVRDIAEYLEEDLEDKGLLMPKIIAPSTWSYAQGRSWLNNVNTTRRRDAIDISASHNTDPGGSAEGFVERSHEILGTEKEIWNTEVHDWKSTRGFDEVLSFSYMMEAINAGFSGLTGWLAIGTTNQGHSYILNQNNTVRRNVKYFIFNKLTNTSHRGQALDIETPSELSHTSALIKDNILTVWAVNPNDEDVDINIELSGEHSSTNKQVTMTYWNTDIDVEGIATNYTTTNSKSISGKVPAGSLSCFEIILDDNDEPTIVTPAPVLTSSFTPDPNKTYYIDVPVHDLRIGSTGNSEDPFTTSTSTTGSDVEWKFTSNGSGSWYIDRADGGDLPRLRTDNTELADMQSTASDGRWESFVFTQGSSNGTSFITSSNGPNDYRRLQVDSGGIIKMKSETYNGSWESFIFTEVEEDLSAIAGTSRVVQITKRNATDFAIDGGNGGENEQDVYLWAANSSNQNQQWIEIDRGNGYYSYQKIGTDFAIDGGNGGETNQNVYLWAIDANNQNQHWQKVATEDGAFKLVKRNAPEFALNGGNDGENGQTINLWSSSSTNHNLQWFITPVDGVSAKSLNGVTNTVIIYPNPIVSIATIQGAANTTVRIYDMNGKIVYTKNIVNENETIDLSGLASGMYHAQVSGLESRSVTKIIKQ